MIFAKTVLKSQTCPFFKHRQYVKWWHLNGTPNGRCCQRLSSLWSQERAVFQTQVSFMKISQCRTFLLYSLIQEPAKGHNLPGQGLKKNTPEEEKTAEEKSIVLQYLNERIEEQKTNQKLLPLLPDFKFYFRLLLYYGVVVVVTILVWSDIKALIFGLQEEPSKDAIVMPDKIDSPIVLLYTCLPLRFLSRVWGRLTELQLNKFARKTAIGSFCWLTGAKLDEALEKDVTAYKSIASFFSRAIDPKLRPINQIAPVVSPSDGKILTFGTVSEGQIEQVKGVTYSLRKFLGPLPKKEEEKSGQKNYIKDMRIAPLGEYQTALMHDPKNNALFQCVIYLSPADYHRFHSPCEWVVKHRRHFPGELLSVNPKLASWVKDLFILNERVVLSGTWKHGYFSMSAVGATTVGSIKIYEDILLKTSQMKWKPGTFYDFEFDNSGIQLKKADPVGEFNFGSTIVLVFEAPKHFQFELDEGQKLKYGEKLLLHQNTD